MSGRRFVLRAAELGCRWRSSTRARPAADERAAVRVNGPLGEILPDLAARLAPDLAARPAGVRVAPVRVAPARAGLMRAAGAAAASCPADGAVSSGAPAS